MEQAEGALPLQEFDVLMQDGPMGLVLSDRRVITSLVPEGQAARAGVAVEDVLSAVNGASVAALSHDETIGMIKACERPLRLTFVRPAAPLPPTAFSKLFNPKMPNAAQVTKGVQAAGSFMKGLLGASVQVIAGMDKMIGGAVVGAVDASTRQASVRWATVWARGAAWGWHPRGVEWWEGPGGRAAERTLWLLAHCAHTTRTHTHTHTLAAATHCPGAAEHAAPQPH
jgi:hypothetical protein